jgi:hypothetical protein
MALVRLIKSASGKNPELSHAASLAASTAIATFTTHTPRRVRDWEAAMTKKKVDLAKRMHPREGRALLDLSESLTPIVAGLDVGRSLDQLLLQHLVKSS